MSIETELFSRGENKCELCESTKDLTPFDVLPVRAGGIDDQILVCSVCKGQLEDPKTIDAHHWRCLNESMWSQVPAVQAVAWRMLNCLKSESWAQDLLDMLYLEDGILSWAQVGSEDQEGDNIQHKDSNGTLLQAGDTVVLIKDLPVKGAGFTAKRGTAVRGISLVPDNAEHIEGRVSGQQIVILTKFVKKS